jgi:urease accessory protein
MTEAAALQKLLTWLSPAFPVGAFAWSAGLESAIAEKLVTDSADLQNWIQGALAHGGMRTDAILLARAWHCARGGSTTADSAVGTSSPVHGGGGPPKAVEGAAPRADAEVPPAHALTELADLCLALTPTLERRSETLITGDAFAVAATAWPSDVYAHLPEPCPYPIAVGAIAAAHGIDLHQTLLAYLTAAVHSQVSVAVRLVPLGQTEGLRVMAALERAIAALAGEAERATLADLGAIAYAADIAQMHHETLQPRLFRS